MRETLYITGAIWVPILCIVAVVVAVMPLLLIGVILERAGKWIQFAGLWLKWRLEEWMIW